MVQLLFVYTHKTPVYTAAQRNLRLNVPTDPPGDENMFSYGWTWNDYHSAWSLATLCENAFGIRMYKQKNVFIVITLIVASE